MAINKETFQPDQLKLIESLKVEEFEEKRPSVRMRNILFKLWQENNQNYSDFNLYYQYRMNAICEMLKNEFEH